MKCPTCHVKLLPVKGELFCMQCGTVWAHDKALPDTATSPAAVTDISRVASAPPLPSPPPMLVKPQVTGWHRSRWPHRLVVALAVVALLAAGDGLARWYYADRVYPGVKVAGQTLGGQLLTGVAATLQRSLTQDKIQLTIDTTDYTFTAAELGITINTNRLADDIGAQGRTESLALVGVARTLISRPLPLEYQTNQATLDHLVTQLAARHSHPAADAEPLVVGSTAVVLAEKPGQSVDQAKLRESLLLAVRNHQHVTVSTTRLKPTLAASAYVADLDDARAKLALALSIKIKTRTVTPTPEEIGGWLSFGEPGSGAQVDAGKVGAYLAGISGTFDRAAAQAAIVAALAAHQPLAYTASTKKNVAPSGSPAASGGPVTYQYCLAGRSVGDEALAALARHTEATLVLAQGWTLGGRIKYAAVASGCNFTLWLVADNVMSTFSPACNRQATCRVGNDVVINAARWEEPPADWKDSADAYRTELINHEVGHWLGFDHASCAAGATPESPVSQVTLTVAGCAPAWHPIPAELQGLKILPGF